MRIKADGSVTPMLFAFGDAVNERNDGKFEGPTAIAFPLLGIAGSFVQRSLVAKQVWIAAGIGITPFLAFMREPQLAEVQLLLSCRKAEVGVFCELIQEALSPRAGVKTLMFVSDLQDSEEVKTLPSTSTSFTYKCGRISDEGLREVEGLSESEVYLCGTEAFRTSMSSLLRGCGVTLDSIKLESFSY